VVLICSFPSRSPGRGQVSNNKLYYRSIDIVAHFSGASKAVAMHALQRAIHQRDAGSDDDMGALPVSAHIAQAAIASKTAGVRVVPTAVLLAACPSLTCAHAAALLQEQPVVARALDQAKARVIQMHS
jgi:hypothetical protein